MKPLIPIDIYRNWATVYVPDELCEVYLEMGSKEDPNIPTHMRIWLIRNCKSQWLVQFEDREFTPGEKVKGKRPGYLYKAKVRFRLERDAVLFKLFIL